MLKSELRVGDILRLKKKHVTTKVISTKVKILSIENNSISVERLDGAIAMGTRVDNFMVNWHEWELDPEYAAIRDFDDDLEELLK